MRSAGFFAKETPRALLASAVNGLMSRAVKGGLYLGGIEASAHDSFASSKAWMPGSSRAMTAENAVGTVCYNALLLSFTAPASTYTCSPIARNFSDICRMPSSASSFETALRASSG